MLFGFKNFAPGDETKADVAVINWDVGGFCQREPTKP
jgi:hypothetical protein